MKFICNKQSLYEAITNVSKAVADKSTITALEGIKLKLKNSVLNLTGYDLEIGIITEISVKSDDEGEIIINSRLFSDIIKRMPTDEILIEVASNLSVTISGGMTEYSITAISAEEYPEIPELSDGDSIEVSQPVLKSMINQTIFAVSQSDIKPILKGELFEIENNTFNMVALDGYRLAVRTEPIKNDGSYKFVVPSKTLIEISRLLKDDDELTCVIKASKKHITFEISGYTVFSRLLEGEFHNYKGSIPQSAVTEVIVSKRVLIDCLERASLLINERIKSPVKCVFENGEMKMSCHTSIGKMNDTVYADITGPKIEIGFNCKYFLDPLKTVSDEKVRLLMNSGNLPMKMIPEKGGEYTFLVLPVRLKND